MGTRTKELDYDTLPDYEVLDKILFQHIEMKKDTEAIIQQGFDLDLVKRVLMMVNRAEFKRYQTPPILRASPKAFGRLGGCQSLESI